MNEPNAGDPNCGCGPTPAEKQSLWPSSMRVSRRKAIGMGVLGLAAAGAIGAGGFGFSTAYADDYPSWDDVQNAMNNEAAKADEIARIQALINGLAQKVAETKAAAEAAGNEFYAAQQAFFDQSQRSKDLQAQADAQEQLATEAAREAGQVAAQLYRNGGDNTSLELFFAGSAANADDLLQKLGQMDRLLARNQAVYDKAVAARNSAQNLSDQAAKARDERDRLRQIAEDKMRKAQEAAQAAQAALQEQQSHAIELEAQLAALRDTTAKTTAEYQAGVAERQRQEEERKRKEEEDRRNNAGNGGGGNSGGSDSGGGGGDSGGGNSGGGGGGTGPGNGWVRPHGGFQSSDYGPRVPDCDASGCSSSFHRGVDLANGCGAPIYAAHEGTVDYASWNGGYGNYIRIQHGGGVATGYAHIVDGGFNVGWGDYVQAGQVIAYAGNTGGSFGCHLHFEVYIDGDTVNPIYFMQDRGVDMS
ncbi:murein DD-endopeptidase MepM/ murein hydrolase activator NlpD [Microbacterium resistens]|uniref:Murein DD-endopeptidase MepM/ murein hydrolase activator NlpD n=1 Tax=Microbacterium resistens TaxID=156977 RepID=A0ABU1SB99_9MICO|nr:peptidoglycan DD-metalloendopeptidase family protein [Microbacterium resistens]MDR6866553.1 murein DD-endopeptidase MepM/ murein hydrolase activator NlpD [Microbacterium resistens]